MTTSSVVNHRPDRDERRFLRIGHVSATLPRRVRCLIDVDDCLRWRMEGHTRGLLDSSNSGLDWDIARRLAKAGAYPEEAVAALRASRRMRRLPVPLEVLCETVRSVFEERLDAA